MIHVLSNILMHAVLPPIPTRVQDKSSRQACLVARVIARSSALAGLDDLDRQNREVALAAVSANGMALQWAPERFRKDKEVALAAVTSVGHALKYVGKELRSDPEVVHAAIQQNALALHFASPRLQRDKGLVLEACQKDVAAFNFAADSLRDDDQFRRTAGVESVEFPRINMNASVRSGTSSSRSWFSASTCDGRWPSLKQWSYRPYLAASVANAISSSEASSFKKETAKRARLGKDKRRTRAAKDEQTKPQGKC